MGGTLPVLPTSSRRGQSRSAFAPRALRDHTLGSCAGAGRRRALPSLACRSARTAIALNWWLRPVRFCSIRTSFRSARAIQPLSGGRDRPPLASRWLRRGHGAISGRSKRWPRARSRGHENSVYSSPRSAGFSGTRMRPPLRGCRFSAGSSPAPLPRSVGRRGCLVVMLPAPRPCGPGLDYLRGRIRNHEPNSPSCRSGPAGP